MPGLVVWGARLWPMALCPQEGPSGTLTGLHHPTLHSVFVQWILLEQDRVGNVLVCMILICEKCVHETSSSLRSRIVFPLLPKEKSLMFSL